MPLPTIGAMIGEEPLEEKLEAKKPDLTAIADVLKETCFEEEIDDLQVGLDKTWELINDTIGFIEHEFGLTLERNPDLEAIEGWTKEDGYMCFRFTRHYDILEVENGAIIFEINVEQLPGKNKIKLDVDLGPL